MGVPSPGGGPEQLVLFVVPRGQPGSSAEMRALCQQAIRSRLNPLFKVEKVSATVVQPSGQGSQARSLLAKRRQLWFHRCVMSMLDTTNETSGPPTGVGVSHRWCGETVYQGQHPTRSCGACSGMKSGAMPDCEG